MLKMRALEELGQILTKCMAALENRKDKAGAKDDDWVDPLTYPPGWNDKGGNSDEMHPPKE